MFSSFFQTRFLFTWFKSPLLVLIPVVFLSGCAKYKAMPLKKIALRVPKNKNEESISLTSTIFNRRDCQKYLGRNVIARGYQPIQISLSNNSSKRLEISAHNFSLPTAHYEDVARAVYTSTVGRAVGYGFVALAIFPFAIPAIVDGVKSEQANTALEKDFARKSLRDQIVEPNGAIEGLVFVPMTLFDKKFTLTVFDQTSREKYVLSPDASQIIVR